MLARPLGAVGEAGKIWAVPNPSSRSDDWLGFQFKAGGARLSRWGARPEVEEACREERSRRKGKELDRTWERRVAAGPPALQVKPLWSLQRCGFGCWP